MKRFLVGYFILMLVLGSTCLFSKVQVGEVVLERIETQHPYAGKKGVVFERVIHYPKAGYISIHFSAFDLAKNDYVEIASPDGRKRYMYKDKGKKVKHGRETISEFWAAHIPGDTAIVRLYSKNKKGGWGFVIDKWARGFERGYIEAVMASLEDAQIQGICWNDNKEGAICYEGTTMYDKSRAVARLLINGEYVCTGWLLGNQGHLMTTYDCIGSESDAENFDYEFMAECDTCSTTDCTEPDDCEGTLSVHGGELINSNIDLNYSLIDLAENVTGLYGYLQFRPTPPTVHERIYIPQHPGASYCKQLAVNDDLTPSGYCRVEVINLPPSTDCPGDIGYFCDTEAGSEGAPVIAYDDHLVVALHHCDGSPNGGVPVTSIIADLITELGTDIPCSFIGGTDPGSPGADFSADRTTIKEGESVTFTDLSSNNPMAWSWTFEGGDPPGSTDQYPPKIRYDTPGTYEVTLTVANAAYEYCKDTETKLDYIIVTEKPYCDSCADSNNWEWINRVQVGSFDNISGQSEVGCFDFTYMTVNLTKGENVEVILTPGFINNHYQEYWRIWIDYNQDRDFTDPGEEVFDGYGDSVVSGNFIEPVPLDASTGQTRMRISMKYGDYPDSCEQFNYGEVEDYTVDIGVPQYTLTTNTEGNGSITLDPDDPTYPEDTVVTLTATPDSGWQFDGWSGDLSGTENPTTITMDSDKTVTATFSVVIPQYTLTVNIVGQGSVTPQGGTYPAGTPVTLTATPPDACWQFDNWSGDLSGSTNPTTITMNSNKTVTANFSPWGTTCTVGIDTVFGSTSTSANRRAMPFTMPENGTITSVTMYHDCDECGGKMILGVYDGAGAPQNRLGVTAATAVNGSTGWHTINLTSAVYVAAGSTVWLAWVYEDNPGIRYQTGSPGRFQSTQTWSGGMPDPFGSGTQASYIYSIYATYNR